MHFKANSTYILGQIKDLTGCATLSVVLLPWAWELKQWKEAERVPVEVAVRVQLRLLLGRGVARREGEAQVVAHL